MSAKPVRTRPTSNDAGSRLTPHVEPLNTTPIAIVPPPSSPAGPVAEPTEPTETAEAPAASAPTEAAASAPATAVDEPAPPSTSPAPKAPAKKVAPRKTAESTKVPTPAEAPAAKRGRGEQFSTRVAPEVLGQARAVVMFTAPYGGPRSLAELVESALVREIQRLADEFNNGQPYDDFVGEFRTGRPLGT